MHGVATAERCGVARRPYRRESVVGQGDMGGRDSGQMRGGQKALLFTSRRESVVGQGEKRGQIRGATCSSPL